MEGDNSAVMLVSFDFNFNPLPPHGGRRLRGMVAQPFLSISIHSLRMEGDPAFRIHNFGKYYFNPLPPHGGRLNSTHFSGRQKKISIHSLRMEGDAVYFADPVAIEEFQSTPSAWRETR